MEEIDLKEMYAYFKSKIMWVIITLIIVVAIGNVFTILTRVPMYKSSTTIILVNNNSTDSSYNSMELQMNKNLVSTYSEIVKSRTVIKKVIKNLDLTCSTIELSNNVSIELVENTELIKISVANPNNKQAAEITDEIAAVFSSEIQKIYKLNNVSIVDKAERSIKPYNINYLKDNVIFVMIALTLSCGIIFIRFYFDTTIKTTEEIEKKLGLTVLGIVPKVERN